MGNQNPKLIGYELIVSVTETHLDKSKKNPGENGKPSNTKLHCKIDNLREID
jgi:hypothetical protein